MTTKTEIRNLKRKVRETDKRASFLEQQAAAYRGRATKAEQEAREWERRFDAVLNKIPDRPCEEKP